MVEDQLTPMQTPSPQDVSWFADVEKLGVIGVLAAVIAYAVTGLARKWFTPWHTVTLLQEANAALIKDKDARIEGLIADKRILTELVLTLRGTAADSVAVMKKLG